MILRFQFILKGVGFPIQFFFSLHILYTFYDAYLPGNLLVYQVLLFDIRVFYLIHFFSFPLPFEFHWENMVLRDNFMRKKTIISIFNLSKLLSNILCSFMLFLIISVYFIRLSGLYLEIRSSLLLHKWSFSTTGRMNAIFLFESSWKKMAFVNKCGLK